MKVNTSNFDLRNMVINNVGELSVRPADNVAGVMVNPDVSVPGNAAALLSFEVERSLSVKSQFTDDIFVYTVGANSGPGGVRQDGNLYLQVLDETLRYGNRKQVLNLGRYRPVRTMTSATVNGQVIISGPDIPTLWGYSGSGLTFARKQDSINVTVETLSVPNGICVSWAGRCVIAKGEALFVSDPLAPRTYTAGGIVTLAGFIYGLHVGVNGDLVAVTSNGVYSLSSQAAAQGQSIIGSIQKLSSYRASDYNCSVLTPNGLFGLSERGIKRIDVEGGSEISLSDGSYVRSLTEMINFPDYRVAEIFETSSGACVSIGDIDDDGDDDFTGGLCMIDFKDGTKSWWTISRRSVLKSIIKSREGDDVFIMVGVGGSAPFTARSYYSLVNRFSKYDNEGSSTTIEGFASGIIPTSLETTPVVRQVYLSSNNGGLKASCAVRGQKFRRNGTLQESTVQANGVVVGVDSWATAMTDARRYKTSELVRSRFDFHLKTNDISLEVGAQGGASRVRILNLDIKGYGVNTA
jgi:hypothetical protein